MGAALLRVALKELSDEVQPVSLEPGAHIELPGARLDPGRFCDYADGAVRQASFGYSLLTSRGVFDRNSDEAKKYLRDFIVNLVAHEVGHTLGLRHNFKASSVLGIADLQNTAITDLQYRYFLYELMLSLTGDTASFSFQKK